MPYDDEPPVEYEPPPADLNSRPVPHDHAAERYVLGAALRDPQQITECARLLVPSDFWDPNHETIWRTLLHLHGQELPTQPAAVVAHLVDTHQTNTIDPLYIFELDQACDIPTTAPHYAERIDRLSRRRAATNALRRSLQRLEAPGQDNDIDQALATAREALTQATEQLGNPTPATSWTPVDLAAVLTGEHLDPPPTMLLRTDGQPLLYDGAVHTVVGESESGKTWFCLLAALQLLEDNQPVLFLDFEDRADRVIGRLMAMGAKPDQIRDHFSYVRPDRPLDDDGRTQLAPHLPGARLVILDGVTEAMTMHGFDLNSNADSALYQKLLPRWIADHGPAVVMIDHVVKDKEKQDRFAIGAQHKLAGIDGVSYLVKTIQPFGRGKRGLARITVGKDRPGHVREYTIGNTIAEFTLDATISDVILTAQLTPPGNTAAADGKPFEPTYLMEKISRYVQLNPAMSKKAIEGAMNGKATTIRLALELLVTRNYIGTKTAGRGAIQHFHVEPYYQPDSDPNTGQTDDTTDLEEATQ